MHERASAAAEARPSTSQACLPSGVPCLEAAPLSQPTWKKRLPALETIMAAFSASFMRRPSSAAWGEAGGKEEPLWALAHAARSTCGAAQQPATGPAEQPSSRAAQAYR